MSTPASRVAVVGAGASALVGELLRAGYERIEAIDCSASALEALARTLGPDSGRVQRRVADVRSVDFADPVDVWHDRAVLHFLTDPQDQRRYAERAAAAVRPGGAMVLAEFAVGGPDRCSGLPVAQHSPETLTALFGGSFALVESFLREHRAPWGATQQFIHAVLVRT